MKRLNEAAEPRTSIHLCSKEGIDLVVLLWNSFIVFYFTFDHISWVAGFVRVFTFYEGREKGRSWDPFEIVMTAMHSL